MPNQDVFGVGPSREGGNFDSLVHLPKVPETDLQMVSIMSVPGPQESMFQYRLLYPLRELEHGSTVCVGCVARGLVRISS